MKKLNTIIAILVIGLNAFWLIPFSVMLIYTGGGPMGWGLLILPFTISGHVFVIPAIRTLRIEYPLNKRFLIFNTVGLMWLLFILIMALTNN